MTKDENAKMNDIYKQVGMIFGSMKGLEHNLIMLNDKADTAASQHTELKNTTTIQHHDLTNRLDTLIRDLQPTIVNANDWAESKKKVKFASIGLLASGVFSGTALGAWVTKILGVAQ